MKNKKKVDPYLRIKRLGYFASQLPEPYSKEDLLRFAKFQLAKHSKRLLKDPIWDSYTEEELLVEFFAHLYDVDKDARAQLEAQLGRSSDEIEDFEAWADKKMKEDSLVRDKLIDAHEDKIRFSPDDVLGDS